jgi:hypothetical protein
MPGLEHEMNPRPEYKGEWYRGSRKLEGKVAVITGGDSGIGRAVAVFFAREGASVSIIYLNEHEDARETKSMVEKEGRECLLISGDVGNSSFCDRAVRQTVEKFGRINILINNAAFQPFQNDLSSLTDDQLIETFRVNIFAYFYMARACLSYLKEGDSIINTPPRSPLIAAVPICWITPPLKERKLLLPGPLLKCLLKRVSGSTVWHPDRFGRLLLHHHFRHNI